jgi:hypothetical protein
MNSLLTQPAVSSVTDNIMVQLETLEAAADMTAASDFRVAQRWEAWNIRLGVAVVLASAAVTALGATGSAGLKLPVGIDAAVVVPAMTVLGSLAAVLASVLTFLKPAERASQYREFGNKQASLGNRIRLYRSVSIFYAVDDQAVHEQLVAFVGEKDALNSDNPPIARWAFARAARDLEARERRQERRAGWRGQIAAQAQSAASPARHLSDAPAIG